MTTTDTTFDLGRYRGRRYFVRGSATPSEQNPDEFSVSVYYRNSDTETNVEIVRVDTSHGHTHFDRLYRRDEKTDVVEWTYWEAVERLMENWRTYAENYEQAHGNG